MSESKLKLKDTEGDPLKQLELLESSTCYQAIGVFSLYNKLKTVGELQMQHVQHISMHGHIKDFTANKEGKVIAIDKLLAGCIPNDTSTALLWAWLEEFVPLWAQVEGGQVYINLMYTCVLLNQLKNGGSVEPHKILVEEVCSGNAAALGAEELEAAAKFQEGLLRVLEKKKKNTNNGSLSEITTD